MSDQLDDNETRNCIRETFVKFIDPEIVLPLFHKHDMGVLTQEDIEYVTARTTYKGRSQGAQALLERLPRYKNWFTCLIQVLQDKHVKLEHAAKEMQDRVRNWREQRGFQDKHAESTLAKLPIDLLLVGRTGHGKSATANSILGKKTFKVRGSSTPTIDDVIKDKATIDGQTVTVVDGPSFGDDSLDTRKHILSTFRMTKKALSLGSHGFSAVVIVLKYGFQYTQQESDAINAIKSFFGKDVIKKYGVIVWTHGDSFELDTEDEDTSFEAWCQDQTGNIADLLQECEYRCVLFNNISKEDKMKAQYSSLMDMVDKIQAGPYTEDDFRRAEPDRRSIQLPLLRRKAVDLLVVGRTRSGKSSIGNSILGKKAFKSRSSGTPLIDDVIQDMDTIYGQTVTVVDGPSFGDDSLDTREHILSTFRMAKKAMSLSPGGFSAVVIVLKYGLQYINQESDAINAIKSFFGKDVVKKYGVIVWTHGDSFELDTEGEDTSFEAWCRDQTGNIADLLQECEYRCVLFNNKSKDETKVKTQYSSLMDMVDKIQAGPYTEDNFRRAEPDRRAIHVPSLKLKPVDLLLVGKTQNGKSSTGNSILGKETFKVRNSSMPTLDDVIQDMDTIYGQTVTVVDGPSFGDDSLDTPQHVQSTLKMAEKAMSLGSHGFSAVVIVLKYGFQYIKQESDAINAIKSFFGRDVVKKYGVIVWTHGDSFELDTEGEDTSFEAWCRDQTGNIADLLQECEYRCVLFNNRSKDEDKVKAQYSSLMDMVDKKQAEPYTEDNFRRAEPNRRAILVRSKLPQLESETRQFLDGINSRLEQLEKSGYQREGHTMLPQLENLKTDVKDRMCHLKRQYGETDELRSLLLELQVVEQTVDKKITLVNMQQRAARDEQRVNDEQRARAEQRARDEQMARAEQRARDEQRAKDEQQRAIREQRARDEQRTKDKQRARDEQRTKDEQRARDEQRTKDEQRARDEQGAREEQRAKSVDSKMRLSMAQKVPSEKMAIDLLLVGRTGNGKSSTGNSILNKKTFKARASSTPTIDDVILETATIDGQTVTVVDGPSFGDGSLDTPQHVQSTLKMTEKAVSLGSHGFSAVVIVLKYGIRYTKKEFDAINAIKSFFGKDVVKKYGVIVWTHGDSFEMETDDEDTSFEAWCRDQTGNIADLLQECEYRCVLFNNRSKDEDKVKAQYSSLMDMVDKIQAGPYTEDNFRRAETDRRAILVRSKLPQLESENWEFLDGIKSRLQQMEKSGYQREGHTMLPQLENLKTDVKDRMCHLKRQYGEKDDLRSLLLELKVVEQTVDSKITLVNMQQRAARDGQGRKKGFFSRLSRFTAIRDDSDN